jgi:hypothetical protein
MSDVTSTGSGATPQSNSPFAQPVPPARTEADAATARTNADLVEARRVADQTPAERFIEQRDGRPQGDRIGDKKLSDAEYNSLTYSERQAYAERRTELAQKPGDKPVDGTKPDKPTDEATLKVGDTEITESELRSLLEKKGLDDSRKLTLPADANGYKLKLPDDFVPPPGIEFKFDEKNPALQQAREFAHKNGFSQEQFSSMVAIHAAAEVANTQNLKTARDAEVAKLGATGTARVTAIETFLKGHLGDELAKPFRTTLVMANQVKGWEIIMSKLANGGAGTFSPSRSPNEPARISDAEYSSMSYSQQKAYAERMSSSNGRR